VNINCVSSAWCKQSWWHCVENFSWHTSQINRVSIFQLIESIKEFVIPSWSCSRDNRMPLPDIWFCTLSQIIRIIRLVFEVCWLTTCCRWNFTRKHNPRILSNPLALCCEKCPTPLSLRSIFYCTCKCQDGWATFVCLGQLMCGQSFVYMKF